LSIGDTFGPLSPGILIAGAAQWFGSPQLMQVFEELEP